MYPFSPWRKIMKIKLKQIMEQNFLDFKRKYLNNMSQMRNGLSNTNNTNNSNNDSNNTNREQLNKSMQTITGNSKGVFAGTKESIGMLKNQAKNTALTSLNKNNNNNITEAEDINRKTELLNDGIKKVTVNNMVHPYTREKTKLISEKPVTNINNTNNNTNTNQNIDNFYTLKAKESPAKLTQGIVPYKKWRKPTRNNPQGYPTPVLHNGFKRYLNG